MDKNKMTLVLLVVGGALTLLIIVSGIRSQYGAITGDVEVSEQEEVPVLPGPRR